MSTAASTPDARPYVPWPLRYLAQLSWAKITLWCYLLWYASVFTRYFDPSLRLWLSSLGIAAIIGTGLYLSTAHGGKQKTKLELWQIARLYMMPFCVSSFAALIKGHGFVLVFDPSPGANLKTLSGCLAFVAVARLSHRVLEPRA